MKLVIFEGPDMCGKTTQAQMLFESDKLKNVLYFHFPMIVPELEGDKVRQSFADTTHYIYNEKHITSLDKVKQVVDDNCYYNYLNKKLFLDLLEEFKNNDYRNLKLLLSSAVGIKINNKTIDPTDYTMIDYLAPQLLYDVSEKDFTIILDRFYMSGDVYNALVPIRAMSILHTGLTTEYLNEVLKKQLTFTTNIMNRVDKIFGYNNVVTYVFKSSKIVEYAVLKNNRELSDYDKNNLMKVVSSDFYNSLINFRDFTIFSKVSNVNCDIFELVRSFEYKGMHVFIDTDDFNAHVNKNDTFDLKQLIHDRVFGWADSGSDRTRYCVL